MLLDADASTTTRELAALERSPGRARSCSATGSRSRASSRTLQALAGLPGVCGVFQDALPADVEVPADLAGHSPWRPGPTQIGCRRDAQGAHR